MSLFVSLKLEFRFSEENRGCIRPYSYLPFGAGPRNCVGMRFALQTIKLCLLHAIHSVQFVRTPRTKVSRLKFSSCYCSHLTGCEIVTIYLLQVSNSRTSSAHKDLLFFSILVEGTFKEKAGGEEETANHGERRAFWKVLSCYSKSATGK